VSPFPEKNIHFYIQNDKFRCIFDAVFNWQKTWTVLEALGHELYGSIAKRSLQKQVKIIQKFSQIKEGVVTTSPPPRIRHCMALLNNETAKSTYCIMLCTPAWNTFSNSIFPSVTLEICVKWLNKSSWFLKWWLSQPTLCCVKRWFKLSRK